MGRLEFTAWQIHDHTGRRKYVSDIERKHFLHAADRLPLPQRALCHTLALTGCRISEALGLAGHHIDAEQSVLTLATLKRRRSFFRVVPVPVELVALLLQVPTTADDSAKLWTMHRATAWRLVAATMERAGVRGPMACCKGLRHGFGIQAARVNVPQNLIQRWMGHSTSTTTAIYLDAVGQEEREFCARMWCC